jgi:signal transduction histidine kinase
VLRQEPSDLIEGLLNFVSLAEDERKLLAAELHDQLLCDLRLLSQCVRHLQQLDSLKRPEEIRSNLDKILIGLDEAAVEARRVMEDLRPSVLESFGLVPALEACLRKAAASTDPPFISELRVSVGDEDLKLEEDVELALYRIIQEARTNCAQHARPTHVLLRICRDAGELIIEVSDDGIGFSPRRKEVSARGVENMKFRAQLIRAQIEWVNRAPARGTIVKVIMPLKGSEKWAS